MNSTDVIRRVLGSERTMHGCTIIARNYLAQAQVLAESFIRNHPDCRFSILVVDDRQAVETANDSAVEKLRLIDIGIESNELTKMPMIYNVTELSTAVKPWLLRHLLQKEDGPIIYFDPDIEIFASLYEIGDLAMRHGIVLTPHVTEPIPQDNLKLSENDILGAGIYNLGFIAVGKGSEPFLDWWSARLRRGSVIDHRRMRFTDQRWIDFVPGLFSNYILRDPGYNVAYWNLHSRNLRLEKHGYTVNGRLLRFFHYSGYNPDQPHLLSKHQGDTPRILLSECPEVARICREYRKKLINVGFHEKKKIPYSFDYLSNGVKITDFLRKLYRDALELSEKGQGPEPPNPLSPDGAEGFVNWLNEPGLATTPEVTRLMLAIHKARPDLQKSFPDPAGAHAEGFLRWVRQRGRNEYQLNWSLVPGAKQAGPLPTAAAPLVNVCGYLRAELGIGEAARMLIAGLKATNTPFYTTTCYTASQSRQGHPFEEQGRKGQASDINIVCVNAGQTPTFVQEMGPDFLPGRYTAGVWWWEIEDFPAEQHPGFAYVDEVWVASEFTRKSLIKVSSKPVSKFHLPVLKPEIDRGITRAGLQLPDAYIFLFSFDFFSVLERKNPLAVITAFKRAFKCGEGPTLVIKSINGDKRLLQLEKLKHAASNRPDIIVRDGYISAAEKNALMGMCDCYVSLHRSEGFGLTMAEAMSLGKPVIATGYSGNLEFMTPENSYLCSYEYRYVGPDSPPYPASSRWANPNVDEAAQFMRQVYSNREEAAARGARAAEDIERLHSPVIAGAEISGHINAIRARRARFGGVAPIKMLEQRLETLEAAPRVTLQFSEEEKRKLFQHNQALSRLEISSTDVQRRLEDVELTQGNIQSGLERRLEVIESELSGVTDSMSAVPYMSDPSTLEVTTSEGGKAIGYSGAKSNGSDIQRYASFEDMFRGPEEMIRNRQAVYVEILRDHAPVIDVGCGRGEMLDLLRTARIPAQGVDVDEGMVLRARAKGHKVVQMDALDFLTQQEDKSTGAIFSAQVVEHLEYEDLLKLLTLALQKLKPGGVLILETVNPHSHRALKTFWVDLTHKKPIFPEALVALCRDVGYEEAVVRFPCGSGDFERDRTSEGEYAVVARTPVQELSRHDRTPSVAQGA